MRLPLEMSLSMWTRRRPLWVVSVAVAITAAILAGVQALSLAPQILRDASPWMQLACGIAIAAAVATLMYLATHRPAAAAPATDAAAHSAAEADQPADQPQTIVAAIGGQLASAPLDDFDSTVHSVLHRLGRLFEADAVYITHIDRAARNAIGHLWRTSREVQPLLYRLPISAQMLRDGGVVQLPPVDLAHPNRAEARCMAVGLWTRGEMLGCLRVESHRRTEPWPAELEMVMRPLGPLLAGALLRHRVERALLEKHAVLDALINATPDLIFIKDEYSRLMGVNAAMAALHCRTPEDMVGLSDEALHPRQLAEQYQRCDRQVIQSGEPMRIEEWIENLRGERVLVETVKTPYRGADGRPLGLVGIARDITARRRAEELEVERQRLVATSRAMDQVLGVVGHDLRTPLACMRALCEALLDGEVKEADEARRFLQGIHDETLRLTDWANHMLDAARLNSGIAAWRWDVLELQKLCDESLEVVRPLVLETVELVAHVEPPVLTMRGDASAIRRLLLNLLTNAGRHTHQGRIELNVSGTTDAAGHAAVLMRVTDTGCGIRNEDAEKLGYAFALRREGHGQSQGDRELGGVGLGLAICNQIVAAHGGHITVRSEPGHGATFEVLLRADLDRPITGETPEPIRIDYPK